MRKILIPILVSCAGIVGTSFCGFPVSQRGLLAVSCVGIIAGALLLRQRNKDKDASLS